MGALGWLIKTLFKIAIILAVLSAAAIYGYYLLHRNENKTHFADGGTIYVPTPLGDWCSIEGTFTGFYEHLAQKLKDPAHDTTVLYTFGCSSPQSDKDHGSNLSYAVIVFPKDVSPAAGCANLNPHILTLPGLPQPLTYCTSQSAHHPSGYAYILYYPVAANKSVSFFIDGGIFQQRQQEIFNIIRNIKYTP